MMSLLYIFYYDVNYKNLSLKMIRTEFFSNAPKTCYTNICLACFIFLGIRWIKINIVETVHISYKVSRSRDSNHFITDPISNSNKKDSNSRKDNDLTVFRVAEIYVGITRFINY